MSLKFDCVFEVLGSQVPYSAMENVKKKEKELKEIIESQKEQLSRYEKKLRGI